jgi:hypothetical protein
MSNLAMKHHNSATFVATITPPAGQATLTIDKAWFTVKANKRLTAITFQKTIGAGITVTNNGTATVTATIRTLPSDTELLANLDQTLQWDLQITESDSDLYTVDEGSLVIGQTVTDDIV